MAAPFKNDDGTVNLDGVKSHLNFVKGCVRYRAEQPGFGGKSYLLCAGYNG